MSNVKFTPEILSLGDQNVHESAAKPCGEQGWTDIIENALVNEYITVLVVAKWHILTRGTVEPTPSPGWVLFGAGCYLGLGVI